MSKRDKRQKASDVFNEAQEFGRKVSFDEEFPQIEDVVVEVTESGHGVRRGSKKIHRKQRLREHINCNNPICHGGGFSIGAILREMVRSQQTELETTETCQGYEGSPKGRREYGECPNFFEIKVSVKYKKVPPVGEGE